MSDTALTANGTRSGQPRRQPRLPRRRRQEPPALATRDARRVAAVILEVLGGARTAAAAAQLLQVTLARYYQLETRAVQKLAGYVFFMRLVVTEPGTSLRNGAPVLNELWSHSFLNVSDLKTVVGDMERSTAELLDQFINEWLRTRRPRS